MKKQIVLFLLWSVVFCSYSFALDPNNWFKEAKQIGNYQIDQTLIKNLQLKNDENKVYVAWKDNRKGQFNIYFNRSIDGGQTWRPNDTRIDFDIEGAKSTNPQLSIEGDNIYIAWQSEIKGVSDIYFNVSIDGGNNWLNQKTRLDAYSGTPRTPIPVQFEH